MTLEVAVSEVDEEGFAQFLQAQIREYNNCHSAQHRAARQPGAVQPLHLMLKDGTGQAVGGLSARTYWGWLQIDDLFVPNNWRRQGLGTSLLQAAEAMAISRGARHSFLSTFGFQARTFYEKQGYRVVGTLEGYPPGAAYFWMRKDLLSEPELAGLCSRGGS
jgi:GNAT superfamily N-acetyltransferase